MGRIDRTLLALASVSALVSVAAGALAVHGIADPTARDLLRTGGAYQMSHALAVFAAAGRSRTAALLFLVGAALFSGSLYALVFGAPRWIGAVTPIGGLSFMIGWAVLAWACLAPRKPA